METIKQVLQEIKNKCDAINKESFMINNGLKISYMKSAGRYRISINNGYKDFYAHNTKEYKLCLYNFHSLCWIVGDAYNNNIPKDVVMQLLDHCGFYTSW